jgi:nuclear receptor subfamily 1 group I
MRKEYILTEEEKQRKRQKIEENRIRKSSITSEDAAIHTVQIGESSKVGEVSSQTVALSSAESDTISELLVAYHKSLEIQMDKDVPRDKANFADLVNIAELSVRRVIAMAKQVQSFKALPQPDQIHLLKGGSIELLILRSVLTFDKEKQHFLDPVDRPETRAMNIDQLRAAESGTGLFDAHMKFVRTLAIDLHADETTLILLLVISLFSPDRGRLICEPIIAAQQQEYCMLLQRYLQSRYPPSVARSLFPRLLMTLTDIRNLDEEHSHVLLKVNPEGIQPLMKEVFDLSL